jgi:hypothetical protein
MTREEAHKRAKAAILADWCKRHPAWRWGAYQDDYLHDMLSVLEAFSVARFVEPAVVLMPIDVLARMPIGVQGSDSLWRYGSMGRQYAVQAIDILSQAGFEIRRKEHGGRVRPCHVCEGAGRPYASNEECRACGGSGVVSA